MPYRRKRHQRPLCVHREKRPCGDIARRSHLQARKKGLTRHHPSWYLDLGLLASRTEKINFCHLSLPICGILLWQPKQTNTLPLVLLFSFKCKNMPVLYTLSLPWSIRKKDTSSSSSLSSRLPTD